MIDNKYVQSVTVLNSDFSILCEIGTISYLQMGFSFYGIEKLLFRVPEKTNNAAVIKEGAFVFPSGNPKKAFIIENIYTKDGYIEFGGQELKGILSRRLVYPEELTVSRLYAVTLLESGVQKEIIDDPQLIRASTSDELNTTYEYFADPGEYPEDEAIADLLVLNKTVYFINLCDEGNTSYASSLNLNEIVCGDEITLSKIKYKNFGYRRLQGKAETVIKSLIRESLVASPYTERNIDFIEIAPDLERGKDVKASFRYDNLADSIEKVAKDGEIGVTAYLDIERKKIVFDVITGKELPQAGTGLLFSREMGNVRAFEVNKITESTATTAIVGGAGQDENRLFYTVKGDVRGIKRREAYVDSGNDEDIELLKLKGNNYLQSNSEKVNIKTSIIDHGGQQPFIDYNIGDKCLIRTDQYVQETRILSIKETHQPNSERKIDVTFMDSFPTPRDKIKAYIQQVVG